MKLIFCSPYKQGSEYVQGGMAIWGSNLISYYETLDKSRIELIPISFDRKTYIVNKKTSIVKRIFNGIYELTIPASKAIKLMLLHKAEGIHICTSGSLGLVKDLILIMIAKKLQIKSIIHFHMGKIPQILETKGWERFLLTMVLNKVDIIMTMDTLSFNYLKNKGYTNLINLPNPISPDLKKMVETLIPDTTRQFKKVLFAGHVVKTKGIFELIEACSTINNVELRIAGRCNEDIKNELVNMWTNKKGSLIFLGELSHEEVVKEMLAASVFSLPSYTEGFPNVILEAMLCECPIVATNVGAIPEMLDINTNNPCGICVKPKDVDSLSKYISLILEDKELATNFAGIAKKKVLSDYSMSKIWEYLLYSWKEYDKSEAISFV